ncbi:UNVERIFIED_CONTAM: hypothetical protein Scaly_2197200 [Sesamum calycinum]|uniref:Aminotransferase-like plant mobile domain-containing protein n=1 Tax=Sesamum calycinum TaxID=2727403 RepID=A0AAW2MMX2_9LAMI
MDEYYGFESDADSVLPLLGIPSSRSKKYVGACESFPTTKSEGSANSSTFEWNSFEEDSLMNICVAEAFYSDSPLIFSSWCIVEGFGEYSSSSNLRATRDFVFLFDSQIHKFGLTHSRPRSNFMPNKSSPFSERHLIILDNQNQPLEKGTMLAVCAPLIGGRDVNSRPRLTNSSHLSEWCQDISLSKNVKKWILRATHHELPHHQPSDDFAHLCTLGRSIIQGDAKWDGDLCFTGEFRYTKGYWEWTEDVLSLCGDRLHHLKICDVVYASLFTYDHNSDIVKAFCEAWCPLTNTLLTSTRELSILLWDLHELVGLLMTGCLYDEVVPSALELTGIDEKRERFIPHSKKKTVRPKSTHNPLGDIAIHERWSTAEETLFAKLCIEMSLKEEVYLAAYLACWLCVFVLPRKDINSICPSTFKMASLMANGRRVNLAIPVLASIYEGLNTVATSPKPAGTSHSFPIHFVYAWLACYFKTHYSVWQELRGPKMMRFSG